MSNQEVHADAPRLRAAATAFGWAVLVLIATAAALRVADALPGVLMGASRGVTPYATLPDLERAVARRLPVPAYYPSTLAWPPGGQRAHLDGSAAYWCLGRPDGALALVVATAARTAPPIAGQVLPEASVLQEVDGTIHGRPARVTRLRGADGALWQQVSWAGARGLVLVRYRGTLDELMRIAASMNE